MGMLVELPFAPFFLSKLLGQQSFLNDLASLDPDLHRNLLFLKNYDGVSLPLPFALHRMRELTQVGEKSEESPFVSL